VTAAAEPRQAATVLILRDGAPGLEVYLLRRTRGMPFAGGMTAYPGGGVDPRDGDTDIAWAGPAPDRWAEAFGCDERTARELVCAAVRETFEEAGVLLAGDPDGVGVVPDVSGDDWEEQRQALLARELSLAELLAGRGLAVRSDLLRPFAHWITPPVEPRRYDTKFFVAALPTSPRHWPARRPNHWSRSAPRSRRRPTAAGPCSPTARGSEWSCHCLRDPPDHTATRRRSPAALSR
jgi:8-oxo-dGTP pyrophosphatase MutT (NUDIX family)